MKLSYGKPLSLVVLLLLMAAFVSRVFVGITPVWVDIGALLSAVFLLVMFRQNK